MVNSGIVQNLKEVNALTQSIYEEKKNDVSKRIFAKRAKEITKALSGIRFEAILNKNQF